MHAHKGNLIKECLELFAEDIRDEIDGLTRSSIMEYVKEQIKLKDLDHTNFTKVDPSQLLNILAFSRVIDHVHDETHSSVTINFPSPDLNVKLPSLELNNKLDIWIASMMTELGVHMLHTKG